MPEMSGLFIIAILSSVLCGINIYKSFDDAANNLNRFIKLFTIIEIISSFFMIMYFTKFFWFSSYFSKIDNQNFLVCLVLAIVVSMNIYSLPFCNRSMQYDVRYKKD